MSLSAVANKRAAVRSTKRCVARAISGARGDDDVFPPAPAIDRGCWFVRRARSRERARRASRDVARSNAARETVAGHVSASPRRLRAGVRSRRGARRALPRRDPSRARRALAHPPRARDTVAVARPDVDADAPAPPRVPLDSSAVKCAANKEAFVAKVEKAGKAALSGLAASALLASVRPDPIFVARTREPENPSRRVVRSRGSVRARAPRTPGDDAESTTRRRARAVAPSARSRRRSRRVAGRVRGATTRRRSPWIDLAARAHSCVFFSTTTPTPAGRPTPRESVLTIPLAPSPPPKPYSLSSPRALSRTTSSRASPTSRSRAPASPTRAPSSTAANRPSPSRLATTRSRSSAWSRRASP